MNYNQENYKFRDMLNDFWKLNSLTNVEKGVEPEIFV